MKCYMCHFRLPPQKGRILSFVFSIFEGEEGEDDVKSAWPFDTLGDTRATMADIMGSQPARGSQSQKFGLSSDCRLQLACMKLESLVIVNQPRHGECVLGSCTHRPSHQESRQYQKAPG